MRRILLVALAVFAAPIATAQAATYYVSPTGKNSSSGSFRDPWRTFAASLPRLAPGDTLYARGGNYTENVSVVVTPATDTARTTVAAYPGERPVIVGKLWVQTADYWTFDGINVTWGSGLTSDQQMVRIIRAHDWRYTNSELWGAHSTAALGLNPGAYNFIVDHNYIHDTYPSNEDQQDHLIYCDTDVVTGAGGTGLIERNVLAHSPNGRAIKIGKGSGSTAPTGGLTIRFNTMVDNRGPSQIQLSYGASENVIYRNIMQGTKLFSSGLPGYPNVTRYMLSGTSNIAYDNVGRESTAVLDVGPGLTDGGGNLWIGPPVLMPDGVRFGPYDDAHFGGMLHLAGANGLTLNDLMSLKYTFRYAADNEPQYDANSWYSASPSPLSVLVKGGHDVILDPSTCAQAPKIDQSVSHSDALVGYAHLRSVSWFRLSDCARPYDGALEMR
jgi:hypothetical protein